MYGVYLTRDVVVRPDPTWAQGREKYVFIAIVLKFVNRAIKILVSIQILQVKDVISILSQHIAIAVEFLYCRYMLKWEYQHCISLKRERRKI